MTVPKGYDYCNQCFYVEPNSNFIKCTNCQNLLCICCVNYYGNLCNGCVNTFYYDCKDCNYISMISYDFTNCKICNTFVCNVCFTKENCETCVVTNFMNKIKI